MLRDANPKSFKDIYIVCGYTDLRYGIDSLAAIIEHRYKLSLFVPNTLFLFCGRKATRLKGLMYGFSIDPIIQTVYPEKFA